MSKSTGKILSLFLALAVAFTVLPGLALPVAAAENEHFSIFYMYAPNGEWYQPFYPGESSGEENTWEQADDNWEFTVKPEGVQAYPVTMEVYFAFNSGYDECSVLLDGSPLNGDGDRITFTKSKPSRTLTVDGTTYTIRVELDEDSALPDTKPTFDRLGIVHDGKTYWAEQAFSPPPGARSLFPADIVMRIDLEDEVAWKEFKNSTWFWEFPDGQDFNVGDMSGKPVEKGSRVWDSAETWWPPIFLMVGPGDPLDYTTATKYSILTANEKDTEAGEGELEGFGVIADDGSGDFLYGDWIFYDSSAPDGVYPATISFPPGHDLTNPIPIRVDPYAYPEGWQVTEVREGHGASGADITDEMANRTYAHTFGKQPLLLTVTLENSAANETRTVKVAVKVDTWIDDDDVYFWPNSIYSDNYYDFYQVQDWDDGLSWDGWHYTYLISREMYAELTALYLDFNVPDDATITVGGDTVELGDSIDFTGGTVTFTVTSADRSISRDYRVTVVGVPVPGPKLFVSGDGAARSAEFFRIEDYGEEYVYDYYDIFYANIGDTELTGLKASITSGGEYVTFDSYWSIREGSTLRPFTDFPQFDENYEKHEFRFMENIGKLRVVPKATTPTGEYDVTVVIEAEGGDQRYEIDLHIGNYIEPGAAASHIITATAGSGGSITPSGSVEVEDGGSKTFTITPDDGYKIKDVVVDGVSQGPASSYIFSGVTANHSIGAVFVQDNDPAAYTITASAGEGGSIDPSGSVTVKKGGSQKFTITPDSGYKIKDVVVDGVSQGPVSSYTFSGVNANHSISASFVPEGTTLYTITATAGEGGSIAPSGSVTVEEGGSQAFAITANQNYRIGSVLVDETDIGAVASHTFSGVAANHSIHVSFVSGGGADPDPDNNSYSGSDSGSSGGRSGTDYTAPSNASSNVTVSQANSAAALAAAAAKASGAGTATVNMKNVGNMTLAALKAMANAAGMPVRFQADSMSEDGRSVDVRITLDPAGSTKDLNLSASTTNAAAKAAKSTFENWFNNKVQAISCAQQGSFGQPVEIAAKFDLTGMDTKNLRFYSYDKTTNTYREIPNTAYWIDSNGYLHFTTELAGDIIISDGVLERKQ